VPLQKGYKRACECERTFLLGLLAAIVCTMGLLTSVDCLELRLMAMEKGCNGRKYIGYVLAVMGRDV